VLYGDQPVIRSDGQFVRDYLHVSDAVDAYLMAAEVLATREELAGEAVNISYEQPVSVSDIVGRILALMGKPNDEPVILGEASNEIRQQYLDAGRAHDVLGWGSHAQASTLA
jgi:CDP-glucose 4,6-dehydratase